MSVWFVLWLACLAVLLACLAVSVARLRRWARGDNERFISLLRGRTLIGIAAAVAMVPLFVAMEVHR